jgi:hypothetical protein
MCLIESRGSMATLVEAEVLHLGDDEFLGDCITEGLLDVCAR